MKIRKNLALGICIIMILVGVIGCSGNVENSNTVKSDSDAVEKQVEEKIIMKMAYGTSPGHPIDLASVRFKELVEERTKNKVEVQLFPSAQLGGERATFEALQAGTIEATPTTTGPLGLFDTAYFVFELPFVFKNEELADNVLDGELGDMMLGRLKDVGIIGAAFWENGFRELTNIKHPIINPDDLNGIKLRTMENEVHMAYFSNCGATTIPLPFPELYSAMQTKTVDGHESPFALIATNKFYEVQKYITKTDHVYSPVVVCFSEIWFDTLPVEIQDILINTAKEVRVYQREVGRSRQSEYIKTITDGGCELSTLTDEEKNLWKEKAEEIYPQFEEKIGKDILDVVRAQGWSE